MGTTEEAPHFEIRELFLLQAMTAEKPAQAGEKRSKASSSAKTDGEPKAKRGRGRPKGSKNKTKELTAHVSRDQRLSARKAAAEKANKEQENKK